MSIYTRTGDSGETSLANGDRVSKNSSAIHFVGLLDELNAHLGICVSQLKNIPELNFEDETRNLERIQNNLFIIGSISVFANLEFEVTKEVQKLESLIDDYEKTLPKLTNFILPGGHVISAQIHLLRSCSRRVEILAHSLENKEIKLITPYLNRLSDYFFVLARYINFKFEISEPIWKVEK
jgi:cob(I)alamin adenosyltransferase